MWFYSTNDKNLKVGLKTALFKGLPEDNGLYMPGIIPRLPAGLTSNLSAYSFQEIAFEVAEALFMDAIPRADLKKIIQNAFTFPAPVRHIGDNLYFLELFHGPSLAFKDFGARFMAELMSYFLQEDEKLTILVATSGDTGGAVAAGFYEVPGIKVVILYPSGKVSLLQEKQLTTLGKNIIALEIEGNFDDCQALVKQAFLDQSLREQINISSANSINVARLIPQSFYYFEAARQLPSGSNPPVFCVPSGNFGNLTAGLIAARMGLNCHHFIAATNVNNVVPEYLRTGEFRPRPSIPTISNAMDVGTPSNFARIIDLYCSTWNNIKKDVSGFSFNDKLTRKAVKELWEKYGYISDPHGAVGYLAAKEYLKENPEHPVIILETAHYSKFLPVIENIIPEDELRIPERLASLTKQKKVSFKMGKDYNRFREWLLHNNS